MNTTFNKKINDLENEVYVTKEHEQHASINELKQENQKLNTRKNDRRLLLRAKMNCRGYKNRPERQNS